MVTPPMELSNSLLTQKVKPSFSSTLSSSVGSSRANPRRGPRQPPDARYTRMPALGLSAKKASSSLRAFSVSVIMRPPKHADIEILSYAGISTDGCSLCQWRFWKETCTLSMKTISYYIEKI